MRRVARRDGEAAKGDSRRLGMAGRRQLKIHGLGAGHQYRVRSIPSKLVWPTGLGNWSGKAGLAKLLVAGQARREISQRRPAGRPRRQAYTRSRSES
jgi:hypothetical protein